MAIPSPSTGLNEKKYWSFFQKEPEFSSNPFF
jgi:hypothetical protein